MAASAEGEGNANVRVIVRVRPPNSLENNGMSRNILEIMDENLLVFDPKMEYSPCLAGTGRRKPRDIRKRRQKDLRFAFDRVFDWHSKNEEVFEATTKTVLDGLLSGYNCSVFAYGATGAGKTFTMLGSDSQPGVIYHTMIHLYKQISLLSNDKVFDVAVSYLEVYNEQIRDLLLPRGTLPIREDPKTGVVIPGLSLHKPNNADELLYMLQFGNKNRTQHPTDANAESSRSHAVFQVFVRQKDRTANISAEVKVAKMCLVDLAGSERATVNKNRGARFREGANINRSLLALGNVINALGDPKYKGHIPYRDSKLTRLLKDSLGGNCRTIMIAAVSPSHFTYEDTYNTLKYADRAKNIRLNMKKNVLNVDLHISRYGQIVEELRREITELKSKLQECEQPRGFTVVSLPADLHNLRQSLQAAYNDRRALRDKQLKQETSARDVQWRLHCTRKCLNRASLMTVTQPEALQKMHGVMQGLKNKLLGQDTRRYMLSQQLQDNTHKLAALQSQIINSISADKNSLTFQVMEGSVQRLGLEVELNDCRHYVRHLRRLARAQEREATSSEALVGALLNLVQHQHRELQTRGPVPQDLVAQYQNVSQTVGQWGVSWADSDSRDITVDGSSHEAFHINTIIDIPLITAGNSLDRVPLPGQTVFSAPIGADCPGLSNDRNQSKMLSNGPGRLVNGQVVFTSASPNLKHPGSKGSSGPGAPGDKVDCTQDAEDANEVNPSAMVHAGHTPNPKKVGVAISSQPASQTALMTPLPLVCDKQRINDPGPEKFHNLNETFSLDLHNHGDSSVSNKMTKVVSGQLIVPVIDAILSPSAKMMIKSESSAVTARNAMSVISKPDSVNLLNSMTPTDEVVMKGKGQKNDENNLTCGKQLPGVKRAIDFGTPERAERLTYADVVKTPSPVAPRQPLQLLDGNSPQVTGLTLSRMSRSSSVLNASHPQAYETMKKLKELGMPSFVEHLLTGPGGEAIFNLIDKELKAHQIPWSNCLALGSDNANVMVGRDKGVFGFMLKAQPNLFLSGCVCHLIHIAAQKDGPLDLKKPSYMQPTRSTVLRVRQNYSSMRDDTFHPRRVQQRLPAHNRSKSATSLNRSGWKL